MRLVLARLGGGGGIRTPDTLSRILPFQGSAFNRSATPPNVIIFSTPPL